MKLLTRFNTFGRQNRGIFGRKLDLKRTKVLKNPKTSKRLRDNDLLTQFFIHKKDRTFSTAQ
jgi:hypothetical protein